MSGSHCLWRSRHPAEPKVEGPECRDRIACGDHGTRLNPGRICHSWSSFMHYRSGSRVTGLCVPFVFHIVSLSPKLANVVGLYRGKVWLLFPITALGGGADVSRGRCSCRSSTKLRATFMSG